MMKIFNTACPRNCYSTCSFRVVVENNKIISIEPNPDNLATPEGPCLKGLSYIERAVSKKRVINPLRRNDFTNNFDEISWDDALDEISEKLNWCKKYFGCKSVLYAAGSGMAGLLNDFSKNFWRIFGGATITYGNHCWPAGLEATRLTLGDNKHNVPWDLINSKLIIFWGKNAAETNIHQMLFVDKAIENNAKVVCIDPRRTPTTEKSHFFIQPKPATDAALALAVANFIIQNNLHDKEFVQKYVIGFEQFAIHVEKYICSWAEKITGIPANSIVKLANFIGTNKPMTIIPGYGMQRYTNGGQTIRALLALQIITGNIGKQGACWHYANLQSYIFDEIKEPECYYPNQSSDRIFRQSISMAKFGEDISNTMNPAIKFLWVERANIVTQCADTQKVLKAIRNISFKVVVDQFMTDTANEADIVLPAKNMFEQSDLVGSYWNPYIQLKQKVIDAPENVKPETEIYYLLAKKLNIKETLIDHYLLKPGDEAVNQYLENKLKPYSELSLELLRQKPVIPKSVQEIAYSDYKFNTPSGKIELYSEQILQLWNSNPLPEYIEPVESLGATKERVGKYPLQLLSPNTKNTIHSQFGNLDVIKMIESEAIVEINPADAFERNINQNDLVRIFNLRGEIEAKAKINFGLLQGCISIFNGYWLDSGASVNFLSVGRETDIGHGTAFHDNMVECEKI